MAAPELRARLRRRQGCAALTRSSLPYAGCLLSSCLSFLDEGIAVLSGIGFCALSLLFSVPFLPYPTSVHWWTYMAVGLSVLLIMIITYLGTPLLIIGAIEIGKLWE